MTKQDFYKLIDKILEVDPGTTKGDEALADIPAWDSLAVVGFIACIDSEVGIVVPARQLIAAKTVDDLRALLGDKISG